MQQHGSKYFARRPQSDLPLSIVNYGVSKHYAGSQVRDRCPLGYLFGFLFKERFCFSLFTETKDDDQMLEDEIDGDLHHFDDDEDITNSSDDIKSRIPEVYSNSACPDEMPQAVASHQGLHCFPIHPFWGFLSNECFCFSLFTDANDNNDMLEDEIDGDLHHSDEEEDISNSSEDQDSESSEKFHRKREKRKQIPRNNLTRKERNSDRKVLNSIQFYSGTRSDINI